MAWKLKAAAALLAATMAGPLGAQAPAKGRLLVATEEMRDPNYRQTVVLLLHHDENGSIGVAVNRPTWLTPDQVAPPLGDIEGYEGRVYRGGPLGATQLIYLVRDPPPDTFAAPPILNRIYASGDLDLLPQLASTAAGEETLRLYAGHSEWVSGQIEREIADGQWRVVDGSDERIFAGDVEGLWQRLESGAGELLVMAPPPRGVAASRFD